MTNFLNWEWGRAYLVTGLIVLYLLRMLTIWLDRKRTEKNRWEELRSTFMPEKGIDWKEAIFTLLAFSLLSVVWPVLAVWIMVNLCSPTAHWRSQLPEAAFKCQSPHLRNAVTPADAETLGTVIDPLGRAPALPFGHLNVGWRAFLGKEAEDFALWYFEVPHKPISDKDTEAPSYLEYRGFAWVKGRKVKAEFVFEG